MSIFKKEFYQMKKENLPENCAICKKQFSKVKFIHHHKCKRCLQYICSECGQHQDYIVGYQKEVKNSKLDQLLEETRKKTLSQDYITEVNSSNNSGTKSEKQQHFDKKQQQEKNNNSGGKFKGFGKSNKSSNSTIKQVKKKKYRICTICYKEKQHVMKNIIIKNNVKFGTNSDLSQKWLQHVEIKKEENLNYYLNKYNEQKQCYQQDMEIIKKDIDDGRSDYKVYNYSFKNFLFDIQQIPEDPNKSKNMNSNEQYQNQGSSDQESDVSNNSGQKQQQQDIKQESFMFKFKKQKKIVDKQQLRLDIINQNLSYFDPQRELQNEKNFREQLKEVLKGIITKFPQFGYCQGMNYIAAFFLCFADKQNAFILMSHLFQNILAEKFFEKNLRGKGLYGFQMSQFVVEKQVENHFQEDNFDFKDQEILEKLDDEFKQQKTQVMLKHIQFKLHQYLLTLLVNSINIPCLFYIWNQMFTKNSFEPMEKAIVGILHVNQDKIINNYINNIMHEDVILDTDIEQLQLVMAKINFDQNKKKQLKIQFNDQFSLKWLDDSQNIHYQLSKISKFEKKEIKDIQIEFNKFILDKKEQTTNIRKQKSFSLQANQSKYMKNRITKSDIAILTQNDFDRINENDDPNEQYFVGVGRDRQCTMYWHDSQNSDNEDTDIRQKVGLDKQEFYKLLQLFYFQYGKQYTMLNREKIYYDQLFDIFVDDNTQIMDFREFICCLSILLRGTITEKFSIFYSIFDKNKKQVLTVKEMLQLIDIVILSIKEVHQNQRLTKQAKKFRKYVKKHYSDRQYLYLQDLLELKNHSFLIQIQDNQNIGDDGTPGKRKNTSCNIGEQLKNLNIKDVQIQNQQQKQDQEQLHEFPKFKDSHSSSSSSDYNQCSDYDSSESE